MRPLSYVVDNVDIGTNQTECDLFSAKQLLISHSMLSFMSILEETWHLQSFSRKKDDNPTTDEAFLRANSLMYK